MERAAVWRRKKAAKAAGHNVPFARVGTWIRSQRVHSPPDAQERSVSACRAFVPQTHGDKKPARTIRNNPVSLSAVRLSRPVQPEIGPGSARSSSPHAPEATAFVASTFRINSSPTSVLACFPVICTCTSPIQYGMERPQNRRKSTAVTTRFPAIRCQNVKNRNGCQFHFTSRGGEISNSCIFVSVSSVKWNGVEMKARRPHFRIRFPRGRNSIWHN